MGNLLGGMALLGLLWWMMQREVEGGGAPTTAQPWRKLALSALGLVSLQIVLGGWSSANFASASCPGLLHCEGDVLAVGNMANAFDPARQVQLDDEARVVRSDALGLLSMSHRLFALFTAAYLAWLVRRLKGQQAMVGTVVALSAFSISQIVVGVSAIWLNIPLLLLTLHNALAAGLLLSSINLLHLLTPSAASEPPG